jgi:hypothetical protein
MVRPKQGYLTFSVVYSSPTAELFNNKSSVCPAVKATQTPVHFKTENKPKRTITESNKLENKKMSKYMKLCYITFLIHLNVY